MEFPDKLEDRREPSKSVASLTQQYDNRPTRKVLDRHPETTPLRADSTPSATTRPARKSATKTQTTNILDNVWDNLSKENLSKLLSKGTILLQTIPTIQEYIDNGQNLYKKQFGENLAPLYGGLGILGLIFFFFILQPLMLVLKFAVFGFVSYSCHYTIHTSGFGDSANLKPYINIGLIVLIAYLFKYLI